VLRELAGLHISTANDKGPFASDTNPTNSQNMTASSRMRNLEVSEATTSAIPSLTTVVPRAFHKTNAFHRAAVPDTPLVREWYARVFADEIEDPACHVLTVIDDVSQMDSREEHPLALGILLLRLMDPSEKEGSGIWTKHAITPDHDREMYEAMVVPMGALRAEIMGGREHFLLELFGVDDEAKGMGLGRKLLQRACEISDEAGVDIFVEGNMFAVEFYRKFGFEKVKEIVLPGEEAYGEAMLVRSAGGGGRRKM
jgi:ribosomal protein S18 acetylase RimI-like enzyme